MELISSTRMRLLRLSAVTLILGLLTLAITLSCARRLGGTMGRTPVSEPEDTNTVTQLLASIEQIKPLHEPLGEIQPGDWLESHREDGQLMEDYILWESAKIHPKRRVLYIQPIGDFTEKERELIETTAEYMGIFFGLPVKIMEDLPLSIIPESKRRIHPEWDVPQIRSDYIISDLLRPKRPLDASAYVAFTASDLWPGGGWNFVFGQANQVTRIGVWSIFRNGATDKSDEEYQQCLLRTMKTGVHETGHLYFMMHCTAYECGMCGSNNRGESDRRPIWFCPECTAKVCWTAEYDMTRRYERLAKWYRKHGFEKEAKFCDKSIKALNLTAEAENSRQTGSPMLR